MAEKKAHEFDGEKYARASGHQKEWGERLIAELTLPPEAAILDLGCGDGVLTAALAQVVPQGSVLGIDASAGMLAEAAKQKAQNLSFHRLDINEFDFDEEFDLIFSNAALHWVKDHRSLLARTYRALKPGGQIRFNFGGDGNCANFIRVVRAVMAEERYARIFHGFIWPWFMPKADEYEWLVRAEPLIEARVWEENANRYFRDAAEMTAWLEQPSLVPFLAVLPEAEAKAFRDEVVGRMIALTRQEDGRCFETFRRINVWARK